MKTIKTFEEFSSDLKKKSLEEDAVRAGEDSKVLIDDMTLDSGEEIKSTEILGAAINSRTEKEFKQYFYDEYGNDAFTDEDMSNLLKSYLEYTEEKNAEEAEAEEAEEDGGEDGGEEDPLADL
jgi:hypothetical protein